MKTDVLTNCEDITTFNSVGDRLSGDLVISSGAFFGCKSPRFGAKIGDAAVCLR